MVSHKKLVNVYLPEELYQALVSYQEQQGFEEASEAVVKILDQFFPKESQCQRYASVEQLVALEGKVTHLSEQVARLSQVIAGNAPTQAATASTVSALDNEYTRPNLSTQQQKFGLVNTNLEEDDEEPDEILYDFLEPGSDQS